MLWKVVADGKWWNIVTTGTYRVVQGFNNKEDALRYVAHLEEEDSKHLLGDYNHDR